MFEAELSGVLEVRAATRYRLQYDAWQRNDPPFMTLVWPDAGPAGLCSVDASEKAVWNQSEHHSHTLPVAE